jgi:hypothetical protein
MEWCHGVPVEPRRYGRRGCVDDDRPQLALPAAQRRRRLERAGLCQPRAACVLAAPPHMGRCPRCGRPWRPYSLLLVRDHCRRPRGARLLCALGSHRGVHGLVSPDQPRGVRRVCRVVRPSFRRDLLPDRQRHGSSRRRSGRTAGSWWRSSSPSPGSATC